MKKTYQFLAIAAIGAVIAGYKLAQASSSANTSANATATIVGSISISKTQDLLFGTAAPGDIAKTVPSNSGTDRASFTVSGQASTAYTITLPAAAIDMITGGGATADQKINVNTWTSTPSGTGTLDGTGNQTLYVGATRAAISATQTAGSYSGSFTVTVAY